ncbi:MAG: peptidyl-alpha-hydroxyglycine alpha-amidating lyase family protein [Vicinamibacterales bacterium]
MPAGRTWGATSAVDIDRDGRSIWVAERCSANICWNFTTSEATPSPLDVVLKFDPDGKVVRSFGKGMFVFPHGIHVDRDGNVWVTDGQDNYPRRIRGAAADAPMSPMPATVVGHQVYKFSPDGKLLLALGKAGGNRPGEPADPASFYQPNDIITNTRGDIFVVEGHGGANARIIKFDRTGKFIKEWGKRGTGPGEMDQPHALAWDSKGRLVVADRSNNRIQIFDEEGKLLELGYEQFSRLSGIWIDSNDVLYGTDSESGSVSPPHKAWTRGIRIGSLKEGPNAKITAFIPDPATNPPSTSAAEGIAVDLNGVIYGAEVGPRALKRYVRK